MPAHPCDSITSLRKPHQIRGIGVGGYFTAIVHHMQKNDGFVYYALGNQFQSPGDVLGTSICTTRTYCHHFKGGERGRNEKARAEEAGEREGEGA